MSIYGELDPMVEHRTQFAFKGKREHIAKVNMSNTAYPNQHFDIEIPHGLREHAIIPGAVKITFNLDIESADKSLSVVNNDGRALVKKEHEEKLLQGIQSANGLIAWVDAENANDTPLIVTTLENANKNTLDKSFVILLDFAFFKYPVYPYGLTED